MTSKEYDKLWEEAHRPLPSYQEVIKQAWLEALMYVAYYKNSAKQRGDDHDKSVRDV